MKKMMTIKTTIRTPRSNILLSGDIYGGTLSLSATCPHTPLFVGVDVYQYSSLWEKK
jgi:hypothetical protein